MKQLLFLGALLVVVSSTLLAASPIAFGQSIRMSPDSAAQGTQLQVTIVGVGTRFSNSSNVSFIGVSLQAGGIQTGQASGTLLNDSTISASISIGHIPTGFYNLHLFIVDSTERTLVQDSAFLVTPGAPYIVSVSPSSAYDSTAVSLQIVGANTNFLTGPTPTISFRRNGTTTFSAQSDSVLSNTAISASVFVPASAAAATYDVVVTNASYSDTSRQSFTVLGPSPTSVSSAMAMIPDSGAQTQQLSVTIVGNGTHFGSSNNVSEITISLERNGNIYDRLTGVSLSNDSTIHATLQVQNSMPIGSYYDLVVQTRDNTLHTFTRDSAFHVIAPPPSIIDVSPSSAYDSETVELQLTGGATHFLTGSSPTITFERNGTTYFTALSDSVFSDTKLTTSVTIPPGTAAAEYNVIVQNAVYSDTGKNKFTVLGPIASAQIIPDSGAASTAFDVTIVGTNTNFATSNNISQARPIYIDLEMGGLVVYQAEAESVPSSTEAIARFSLPDSLAPGLYIADIHGNSYDGSSYDYHTNFRVTPIPNIIISNDQSMRADTVTVYVHGSGVHFISGSQVVQTVQLIEATTITASKVIVTSDTSLSAFFAIPLQAPPGLYDIDIVEPVTNRTVILHNAFTVATGTSGVANEDVGKIFSAIHVSPNPTPDNVSIFFELGEPSLVQLRLFDALGHAVATLCNRHLTSGEQSFQWSAKELSSGSYYYELQAGPNIYTGQIVVQH